MIEYLESKDSMYHILQVEELHGPREDRPDDQRAGQRVPAVPAGGEQARLDVGLTRPRIRHRGEWITIVQCRASQPSP